MAATIVKARSICNYTEVKGIKCITQYIARGSPLMLYTGSTIYWETAACRKH